MRKTSKKNQQGAIGLFGVLTLMMAVLFVAVAVDSGRMWMEKRKLQNIADMAAIAAGGQVGGCMQNNTDVYRMAAQGAAMANGYQGSLLAAPNVVELGGYSTDEGGVRTFVANGERRAVHVLATQEVPSSLFAGGIFNQRIVLQAEAVAAVRAPVAALRAGSTAIAIDTAESALLNSLLGRVLQTTVQLSAADYRGLANANITLLDLVKADPTIGSVSELLGLNNMTIGRLMALTLNVANEGNNSLGSVVDVLGKLQSSNNPNQFRLGDVIHITNPDSNAGAAIGLNLLSLIQSAAFVANGNNFIDLPLGINLLGLTSISSRIRIIEPPQLVIGPPAGGINQVACAVVRTAQLRVETSVTANVLLVAGVDLKLNLEVAQGRAELMEISSENNRTSVVVNAYPGLAALTLTNNQDSGPAEITLLAGSIPLAKIGLKAPIAQAAPSTMTFEVGHPVSSNLPMVKNSYSGVGNSLAGFANTGSLDIKVLGLNLGLLDSVVTGLVVPLLAVVTSSVLDPLLKLLGINTAGITIILDDVNSGSSQGLIR
ncbi:TadG family pilus assembly protein [Methylobacillus sp. Pita1]|uniref:TadG family pilus assembly protein n=1 Tax=Methylobacillus sp. Pita1 TaxID=3382642 RepID=UPI0038B5CC05